MSNNVSNRTAREEPELVDGEIIEVEETRVRVRLDSGSVGFAPLSDAESGIRPGERGTFRVTSNADGALAVAFAEPREAPVAGESFDRDVVRLHNALANHHPSTSTAPVERVSLGEEQITAWLDAVETSIDTIRKNRAKRLNEEFYNS